MAEASMSNPLGAEISERTREFVLPDEVPDSGVAEASAAARDHEGREIALSQTEITTPSDPKPAEGDRSAAARATPTPGRPLPGDRGPRSARSQEARPSFWRRIALGRRGTTTNANAAAAPASDSPSASAARATPAAVDKSPRASLAQRVREGVSNVPAPRRPDALDAQAVETRIVEPMLQALVSVEAKLERSHTELVGRSDQVEQRLTQLWDIEEQLGQLNELQVSLRQVSEQQRRLESAVVAQTTTLRWLVGAVFFSLAAAAFTVALLVRA